VGGARTALFCWAFAKRLGGRFMIRIEDTDAARSSDESARGILDDLAWLGLEWDDGPTLAVGHGARERTLGAGSRAVGPFFQAQRVSIYNAYIEFLFSIGRAYPAFETSAELDAARKEATARKATFKYPRPADVVPGVAPTARVARAEAGEAHVVRFVMPGEGISVKDEVLGEVKFAAGEVDDFVIRKADGLPTYHFAVVIDDELMGVTHVLRAQEHLINTPRHVALQRALLRLVDDRDAGKGTTGAGFRTPRFAHMPLISNMDGSKMSKRDKAKAGRKALKDALAKGSDVLTVAGQCGVEAAALQEFAEGENDRIDLAQAVAKQFKVALPEIEVWDYRESGYLPEAVINFLSLLGWNPGQKTADGKDLEKFDHAFLAENFSLERIGKQAAKFDRQKLLSFNADALMGLSDAALESRLRGWAAEHRPELAARLATQPAERLAGLVRMAKPRCKTLADFERVIAFALVRDGDVVIDPAARVKVEAAAGWREHVVAFRGLLAGLEPFTPAGLEAALAALASERGVKLGEVAQSVRVALTGTTVSPPLGEALAALGRASSLARIDRLLA